jgi:hypothetical protein
VAGAQVRHQIVPLLSRKACYRLALLLGSLGAVLDRLKREKMLIKPAKEWHFYRLVDRLQGRSYKKL